MLSLMMALALAVAPNDREPAIPRFDVGSDCAAISRGISVIQNRCIEDEQWSYDATRAVWADLAPKNRRYCLDHAVAAKAYRYRLLAACALPRAERDRLDQPHKFHY